MVQHENAPDTTFLFQVLAMIGPLKQGVQQAFNTFIKEERFPKKHALLKAGETCKRIWLVKKGFARAYYHDLDGHEHTTWFMGEGTLIISVQSFYTQKPSYENIELLEDSVLQSISWQELQTIYAEHAEFNYHGRCLTEHYYIQSEHRAIMLRYKTPDERYDHLLKSQPHIFQQAGQSQIASYLGIQRETLSRLRKARISDPNHKNGPVRNFPGGVKAASLVIFLILALIIQSCKKEQTGLQNETQIQATTDSLSLKEVQAFYQQQSQLKTNSLDQRNILSAAPDWGKAQSFRDQKGNYWLIHQNGKPIFQGVKQGYRKLAFLRDSTGKVAARLLEIIPDVGYYQRNGKVETKNFTGRVFIYDQHKKLLGGLLIKDGKRAGTIKAVSAGEARQQTNALKTNTYAAITECTWYQSSYIDGDGVFTVYAEQICSTSYYDFGMDFGGGGGFDGGGSGSGDGGALGGGGGGGGEASSAPPAAELPDQPKSAVNPKAYMECFSSLPDIGSKETITVYVQEPQPGLPFNYGVNSVGHTAISLSKTYNGQTITQTVGFYPTDSKLAATGVSSKVVDNSNLNYTVSISYQVIPSEFNRIANFIANAPATYDLYTYNCTNFVYDACKLGNITLPDPTANLGLFQTGMSPGALGNSIRDVAPVTNSNTKGGTVGTSHGPCNQN